MNRNATRNLVGAALWAYGITAMGGFFVLSGRWLASAPTTRDAIHVFEHNEHGSFVYYNAEQATALALLFMTSIPIAFLGLFISPKKNVVSRASGLAWRATWEADDPKRMSRWGYLSGALIALGLVFVIREPLIASLIDRGVVLNIG
ncbi:hypothetical protein [Brevundimonas sp.]|uniref:hypothetical protein n=1 Tax=Brevundimonas sp. TaxID=1871086 RepID=UPI00272FB1CC|nr:hypothetical protein [Brevundimonas sp.]MDP1913739.1 hypothetical protein [Brevundimonas sp.]